MKEKMKWILGIIIVIMLCLVAGIYVALSLTKKMENYPESTLAHEAGGELTYIPSEVLSKEISCPTLPFSINFPENIVAGTADAIVANYSGYRVVVMESADTLENALSADLNTAGIEAISAISVDWSNGIYDSGYINSLYAEYIAGRAQIAHDGISSTEYGVAYRIAISDTKNLMLYVSSNSIEALGSAKNLLDAIVYTIQPDSETMKEAKKEAGVESSITMIDGEDTSMDNEETPESAQEIEFMETTEAPVYGQIKPDATADKEIYLERDYENMVIFFGWTNISKVPTSVKVSGPDGREYVYDNELSHRGEYVYLIGKGNKGDTYHVSIETMDSIYGCTYYPMEYTDYIAEMYPDDETALEKRGGAPAETDDELNDMAPPADEKDIERSRNGNTSDELNEKNDKKSSIPDGWEDNWQ